jgi:hypothetical protein
MNPLEESGTVAANSIRRIDPKSSDIINTHYPGHSGHYPWPNLPFPFLPIPPPFPFNHWHFLPVFCLKSSINLAPFNGILVIAA